MKHLTTYFLLALLSIFVTISACKNHSIGSSEYSFPTSAIDSEIDGLLSISEEYLFLGNFNDALTYIEKAKNLLPFCNDENNHRKLRFLFDKAVIITCIEGPNDNSHSQFAEFNNLLILKSCNNNSNSAQTNLFDQNGHWPILGEDSPISIENCLDRVESIERSLQIACAGLKASRGARIVIEATIFAIAKQARQCCTQHGFWKTCIQPVVDSWKKADLLGIPPDPYWD